MKSRKENNGIFSNTKNKIGSLLRLNSKASCSNYIGPSYLGSRLPPPIISVLLPYLDTISLTRLEQCCHLLRYTVISTREYRRRVNRMLSNCMLLDEEEDKQTDVENSLYYKHAVVQYLRRKKTEHSWGLCNFVIKVKVEQTLLQSVLMCPITSTCIPSNRK
eukprot:GFUD01044368.1.p1 GENE.GFUD01044368.1~~GFUD01044368.1.p1  ORF type:complete len:162 (-),score=28.85 GFUD01044368.1:20-505(-)